jgi:glycosyltransferase involved in cell wall biosynthesis
MNPAILHLARSPFTGVWSVIRSLAGWQKHHGRHVAVGVLETDAWTERYAQGLAELEEQGIPTFTAHIPDLPYTVLFPWLMAKWRLTGHPWERWIPRFCSESEHRSCVVHCHNAWLSGAYVPYRGDSSIRVGFAATYHGIAGAEQMRRSLARRLVHRYLAQRFVRHAGALASVDRANTEVAQELFRIAPDRFDVIPNGILPPDAQGEAPFPTDRPAVGHVGALDEGKGWRYTAEGVRLANERGVPCRFVVVGSGPQEEAAREWCARHPDMATFLGYVDNAGTVVTPHLDLYAIPSEFEGSPMAAIEALAAGVPVVGTGVFGLAEIIRPGRSGERVERNAESVADALCGILAEPGRLERLRQGARELFRERFHIERTAQAYSELYRKALAMGEGPAPFTIGGGH